MRIVIVGVAVLVALVALVVVRLAGSFGQLEAIVATRPASPTVETVADERDVGARDATPTAGAEPLPAAAVTAPESGGDEHIVRMLASDPEFARAAEQLLHDPDPTTRREARQLLRELGVPVAEGDAHR